MDSAELGKLTPQEEEAALGVISVKDVSLSIYIPWSLPPKHLEGDRVNAFANKDKKLLHHL